MLKKYVLAPIITLLIISCNAKVETTYESDDSSNTNDAITEMKLETLLNESVELADSLEVVMSYLELPKNTTLPTHYHPGEEFAYIIEGSGQLTLQDESKMILKAGSAQKIPLKKVHSFATLEESAKLVVFRLHIKGQPERILVE